MVTFDNTLGNQQLAVLTVLGDHLEECTDLVFTQHRRGRVSNHPLIKYADLLVKLGALFVPVPALGLPFVMNLLDHISCKIALEAGSTNDHKLALACKIGLAAALLHLPLPGDKVNLPR